MTVTGGRWVTRVCPSCDTEFDVSGHLGMRHYVTHLERHFRRVSETTSGLLTGGGSA